MAFADIVFALSNGSFLFLGAVLLMIFGMVFGLYSRRGNAIAKRPTDGRGEAPGAEGPAEQDHDRGEHTPVDHGTR